MPYWERASDMYSLVESVIVNAAIPGKYLRELVKKKDFEREAEEKCYQLYDGYVSNRRNTAKSNSF